MVSEAVLKLTWHGEETVDTVLQHIAEADYIEIVFPSNYNHALFRALHPEATQGATEDIDVQGGVEILQRMARVSGLESVARLRQPLAGSDAQLELYSPPRLIISLTGPNRDLD